MDIIRARDYEDMSLKAAGIVADLIRKKPDAVLGLATGSSPIGLYKALIDMYQRGELDMSGVTTANLDEYVGLSPDNEQSYRYFMDHYLFDHVNIDKARTFVPDGMAEDADAECRRYEALLSKIGERDLQLLGLGLDGHIGFNEPSEAFSDVTCCVELDQSTIEANKRFFSSAEEVPGEGYTMGIGTIMRAKKILMVVNGEAKANILEKVVRGPVCPGVPASILRFHRDVTIVADEAALSKCL